MRLKYNMKSDWKHILWATVALGALFVALQAVQAWKASMTSELTQKANNGALQSQLDALKAERAAATTPEQQAQLVSRYLAPIWQKHAIVNTASKAGASYDGETRETPNATPESGRQATAGLPDAPSAVPPDMRQFEMPSQPGELFGGDFYVPPPFMGDFSDHESQCKQDSLSLTTCQQNLKVSNKAARGGGFFHRLTHDFKLVLFTAGATAAAVCATGHCK